MLDGRELARLLRTVERDDLWEPKRRFPGKRELPADWGVTREQVIEPLLALPVEIVLPTRSAGRPRCAGARALVNAYRSACNWGQVLQ